MRPAFVEQTDGIVTATPSPPGRTVLQLARDRAFGPFLVGSVFSSCGNWIQQIAAAVLMFELTRSAFMVGMVSVLLFAAPLLLALWTGSLTDRYDRRRLLMIGRLICGVAVGLLALAILGLGADAFGGPTVLLVAAGAMGVGHAISAPALQALTPGLVPDEDLEQALAFGSVAPSIARTVGPAAGALLLLAGGPGLAFLTAAVTHLVFVAFLAAIRARTQGRAAAGSGIWGGVRYLRQTPAAAAIIVAIALLGFGADPVLTLSPSLAAELDGGTQLVGVFTSTFGVGAVLFVIFFRPLRRLISLRWVGCAGMAVVVVGLAVAAFVHSAEGAAIGFLVSGGGFMMATVALAARLQRRVPDQLRGRVMALWGVAFLGSRPIVAATDGALADLISVTAAMLIAAAIVLAATPLALVRYRPPAPGAGLEHD